MSQDPAAQTAALLANPQRRILDLSIAIENDIASDPEPFRPQVTYHRHDGTHDQIMPFFPGLEKSDLPDEEAWAVVFISMRLAPIRNCLLALG